MKRQTLSKKHHSKNSTEAREAKEKKEAYTIIAPLLPTTGYLRLHQFIGDRKSNLSVLPMIPVSKSSWWAGVKAGIYPQPVKLGPRTTAWKVEDIRELIANLGREE